LPFNDETKQQHGQKKQKSFIDAMWEIENDPSLKSIRKVKKQNTKNDQISEENIDVDTEEIINEKSESPPQSSSTNNEEGDVEIDAKSINEEPGDYEMDTSKDPDSIKASDLQNSDKIEIETTKRV
jgi:hypothetical protein